MRVTLVPGLGNGPGSAVGIDFQAANIAQRCTGTRLAGPAIPAIKNFRVS
jgi:hypothetical protein